MSKKKNNRELSDYINKQHDSKKLISVLEKIGYLPSNFNGDCLIPLLKNKNEQIRLLAIKNIGKLNNGHYLKEMERLIKGESNSIIRREAVSAIGRMRSQKAIPVLLQILKDPDPKVIMQAIRGLLVFKSNPGIKDHLVKMSKHKNEMIQSVIDTEFNGKKRLEESDCRHSEYPKFLENTIVHGDVRNILKCVPDESIHLTFTSPPYYNARDYSIYQSYKEYLEFLVNVFKEVYRITKEGRFFILNTSPIIIPRASRKYSSKRYPIPFDIHHYLTEMGWEFIDDIIWLKPEASVKNRNAGFLQHRKPLAYKPNSVTEMLMVYRKKSDKLIDWNIRQYDIKIVNKSKIKGDYETSNVWRIDPTFDKIHTAVFPIELCKRIVKFYSYVGDIVFDPFAGRGTFGKAALGLDRHFFLTEIKDEYIKRIKQEIGHSNLFNNIKPKFIDLESFKSITNEGMPNEVKRKNC